MESQQPPDLVALVGKLTKEISELKAEIQKSNGAADQPKVLISEAVNEWLLYGRRFTERTQSQYQMVIQRFVWGLPDDIRYIGQLAVSHIQDHITIILRDGFTNSTATAHLIVIKSFCRWLSETYNISNEASKVKVLKGEPPRQRFITPKEYTALLKACSAKFAQKPQKTLDLVITLANTGLRATEMENLNWDNINEEMTFITITGKGRKRRIIPINSAVIECLSRYPRISGAPIQFTKNRREQYRTVVRLCRSAGIERAGPHALRHYCATQMLANGASLTAVSRILGHFSPSFTEKLYIHLHLPTYLKGATEVLCKKRKSSGPHELPAAKISGRAGNGTDTTRTLVRPC